MINCSLAEYKPAIAYESNIYTLPPCNTHGDFLGNIKIYDDSFVCKVKRGYYTTVFTIRMCE